MTLCRRTLASLARHGSCSAATATGGVRTLAENSTRRLAPSGAVRWRSSAFHRVASPLGGSNIGTRGCFHGWIDPNGSLFLPSQRDTNAWGPTTRGVATTRIVEDESGNKSAVSDANASTRNDGPATSTSKTTTPAPPKSFAVDISDSTDPSARFYGAPADYAGVTVRSSINWPLPLDVVAKLNPQLALAMGASAAHVAESNRHRPKIDPVLSGRGKGPRSVYGGSAATLTDHDGGGVLFQGIDPATCDPDELAILQMLTEDEESDGNAKASELSRARGRREVEKTLEEAKKQAQLAGRKNAPYAKRLSGEGAVERAKEAVAKDLKKVALEREKLNLTAAWVAAKQSGDFTQVLPVPGEKPGVTPRVYNQLKLLLLRKSDKQTMAKHVTTDLTATALRRLRVADLKFACGVLGVPAAGDKQLLVEMLKHHFESAEIVFAQQFVSRIGDLDKEVALRMRKAKKLAAAETNGRGKLSGEDEFGGGKGALLALAAQAAGVAAREKESGVPKIGERASARAVRAAARLRGWDDDDESGGGAIGGVDGGEMDEESDEDDDAEFGEDEEDDESEEAETPETADGDDLSPDTETGRMKYANAFHPNELVALLLKAKGGDIVTIPVSISHSPHFAD